MSPETEADMSENKLRTAKVKATGNEVHVYKQIATGKWINYENCTTVYETHELDFTS